MKREIPDRRLVAAQPAAGIAPNPNASPCPGERVNDQQPSGKADADAQQLLDHLGRLQAAERAAERAEYARLGAARDVALRWRRTIEAAVARPGVGAFAALVGLERGELPVEAED